MSPRIPLGDLKKASEDPTKYRAKLSNFSGGYRGSVYFNALRNAIFNYHKPDWTATQAEQYLERSLENHPNALRKAEVSEQLRWYVGEYVARGWTTFRTRLNVSVPLPSWASSDLSVSGEISRIDLVPSGGYAGWLLLSGNAGAWRDELRMPLIQKMLAQEMNITSDEITVGVYALREGKVEHTSYSAREIKTAHFSLENLLLELCL